MGLDISHSKPTMKSDSALDYFTLEDLKGNPDFIERHKNLVAQIEGDEDELIDILYFRELGYQRKQMNVNFSGILSVVCLILTLRRLRRQCHISRQMTKRSKLSLYKYSKETLLTIS